MKVEFKKGFAVGFAMAIPECFRESIAKERFNSGDILYDDRRAYMSQWREALPHISYAVQVLGMTGTEVTYVIMRNNHQGSLVKLLGTTNTIEEFLDLLKLGIKL